MCNEQLASVEELASILKYSKQTIYNKISTGEYKKGEHYTKLSSKKILFYVDKIFEYYGLSYKFYKTSSKEQIIKLIVDNDTLKKNNDKSRFNI